MKRLILLFLMLSLNIFSLDIVDNYVIGEKGEKILLKEYKRIVIYNFGAIEILYKLGADKNIVAIANHSKKIWPQEKTQKLPLAGSISKPSLEKILSFNPDLVIFNVMGNEKSGLEKFNIPSITFSNKNLDDILKNTLILGKLVNREKESKELVEELNNKLKYIRENFKLQGKAVILYSDSPPTSFEKNSLPVEILETLGLDVIVPKVGKKPIISSEYILKENPKYIIGTRGVKNIDGIKNGLQLIEETDAYKNKNIYVIDSSEILRAS
ncbi:MAG: ABC transporter substrate-binding protein, partial [Cetobacterium sp.]